MTALTLPLLAAAPAFANGSLQGAATIKTAGGGANLQSGTGATNWTLRLPAGASCPGDGPNDGYRWQTYMVPSSIDPGTLTFDSGGPTPQAVGASFRQPLFDTSSNPVINQVPAAASPAPGPGPIINIPDVNFQVFSPGNIPAGVYNIGIACTLGGPSATQESNYWNVQMSISSSASGGNAQVAWQNGTAPVAPVATTLTPGDGQVTVAFTSTTSNPATTGFTATATGPGGPFTASGAGSPLTITGLTNQSSYSVTVHATNSVGNSPESNALSATPGKAAVTGLAATPGPNKVDLTWTAPASPPASYSVDYCSGDMTASGAGNNNGVCDSGDGAAFVGSVTPAPTTPSASVTGLTPGQLYTFTVYYPQSFKSSVTATPLSNAILMQDVTVTRPTGALVLTQVCGNYGALPAEGASTGFSAFPAQPAGTAPGGTSGPKTDSGGIATTTTDPNYPSQYPNPANPTYPTHCSLDLGTASLVTSGPGAGQFFATSGRLNQVTVVDSRDTDPGWTVSARMGGFSAGAGKTFSGSELGWTNTSTDTAAFQDANGTSYDQTVLNDPAVAPNTPGAGGSATSHPLAHAVAGSGLGIATVDARVKLLIPIFARNGTYTGELTITAV